MLLGSAEYHDRVEFVQETVEEYVAKEKTRDERFDVVYSNATLHWIPSKLHNVIFPQMIQNIMKKSNSVLAIQMPDAKLQPSHLLMETGDTHSYAYINDEGIFVSYW